MILVVYYQYQSFLGKIVSPQARYQSWSPLLETLLEISLLPSKPHFPKFPHQASCAWFMNQIIHLFSKVVSCLVVILKPSQVQLWIPLANPFSQVQPIFCYQRTSQSHVFFSFLDPTIHSIASTKPHYHLLANPKVSQAPKHSLHSEKMWIVFGYKSPPKI